MQSLLFSAVLVLSCLLPLAAPLHADAGALHMSRGRAAARTTVVNAAATPDLAIRIGHGYDIHRMASREEAGQPVVISGVKFDGSDAPDFDMGCVAHSDGDVVYHSVVRTPAPRTPPRDAVPSRRAPAAR